MPLETLPAAKEVLGDLPFGMDLPEDLKENVLRIRAMLCNSPLMQQINLGVFHDFMEQTRQRLRMKLPLTTAA